MEAGERSSSEGPEVPWARRPRGTCPEQPSASEGPGHRASHLRWSAHPLTPGGAGLNRKGGLCGRKRDRNDSEGAPLPRVMGDSLLVEPNQRQNKSPYGGYKSV